MAAGWAEPLSRFRAGTCASFLYSPRTEAVVLDLAVQAAGLVAVPRLEGLQGRQERQGHVEVGSESVVLPSWEEAERSGAAVPEPKRLAGGAVFVGGDGVLPQWQLFPAAERLMEQIPALPAGRRHVMVLSGFAGDLAERLLLSWATVAGAALLLEPEPAHHVPTAVWARPTVFAGTVADLARLREAVERDESGFKIFGRRRLPFGRLQAVLSTEGEPPDRPFWEERGARCLAPFAAERQERGI